MKDEHIKHQKENEAIIIANKKRHDEFEKEVQIIKPKVIKHIIAFLELNKNQEFDASEICVGLNIGGPNTVEDIAYREILYELPNISEIKCKQYNYMNYYSYNNPSSFSLALLILILIVILVILFFVFK
jgi:uncharacterized protein (UPF0371 family)